MRSPRSLVGWLLVAASLALPFGPAVLASLGHAHEPLHLNDDARQQVWPFLRYHQPGLLADDLIASYELDTFPAGARLAWATASRVVDPRVLGKILPYLLAVLLAGLVAPAARRLGGWPAAWGSLAVLLSAGIVFDRMIGGLPRAWALPIAALAALGLVTGRPLRTVAAAVLAAAVYPPAGVVPGVALALWLVLLPQRHRGGGAVASAPLAHRLALLAGTVLAMGLLVLPVAIRMEPYGPMLAPADVAEFPEAGPHGRYRDADRPDYPLPRALRDILPMAVGAAGEPWWPPLAERLAPAAPALVATLTMLAWFAGARGGGDGERRSAFLRLGLLPLASLVAFAAAGPLAPYLYLPQRHLVYTLPIFVALALPAGAAAAGALHSPRGAWLAVPLIACLLLAFGTRGPGATGYTLRVPRLALYDVLAALPPDSLIAGWPGGLVDLVPYVSGRPVLVSFETHHAFHRGYAEAMRRRMRALIDLHFATDLAPAARLRDEHGVTHLLLDGRRLHRVPRYFAPFDGWIAVAAAGWRGPPEALIARLQGAVVASDGPFALISLDRLLDRGDNDLGGPP